MSNAEITRHKALRWRKFCLDFRLYQAKTKLLHRTNLKWKVQRFRKNNGKNLPTKQGVYMFVLNIDENDQYNGACRYVLYVGQADNLRSRFKQYFGYKSSTEPSDFYKRSMILIWNSLLDFYFAETPNLDEKKLTDLEFDLIDGIIPRFNQRFRGRLLKQSLKLYTVT